MKYVVVAIIKNDEDQYLLVSSKKQLGEFTGAFYPPGGSIKPGETKKHALRRELREELQAQIKPIRQITQSPGDVPDQTTYWWECELLTDPIKFQIRKEELACAGFFSREEIKKIRIWPATERFFQNFIDRPTVSGEHEQ